MKKEWNEEQFKAWKDKVNNYIIRKTGLSADDLPDFCYADYFERGEHHQQRLGQQSKMRENFNP